MSTQYLPTPKRIAQRQADLQAVDVDEAARKDWSKVSPVSYVADWEIA